MRYLLFLVAVFVAVFVASPLWADDKAKLPANLQTVLEPQITITTRGADKVEEYRISGRLYMVKVTPKLGAPYYLVDDTGDGNFVRQSLHSGIRVPQWVLLKF